MKTELGGGVMAQNPDTQRRDAREKPRRRPYTKPVLTRYGSLARLTQTGVGTMSEGAASNRRNCL